jgi:hypothetical protein
VGETTGFASGFGHLKIRQKRVLGSWDEKSRPIMGHGFMHVGASLDFLDDRLFDFKRVAVNLDGWSCRCIYISGCSGLEPAAEKGSGEPRLICSSHVSRFGILLFDSAAEAELGSGRLGSLREI